jgi:hypothetical protein
LLVYPDYVGKDGQSRDGHVGIVLEANGAGVAGVTKIIHCSLGAYRAHGDDVQITGPAPWLAHASSVITWFDGLEESR